MLVPRSFSIIAGTLYGNRGAQAMTETVVGHLREDDPHVRVSVFSYYPTDDRRILADPTVSIFSATPRALVLRLLPLSLAFGALRLLLGPRALRLAPPDVRALGRSTALVDVAGVAFIDGREKFLPFNVLTLVPAWLLGVPVVKMSQAMGPYQGRLNRLAARMVLPRVRMVWARGRRTREHLEGSGIPGLTYAQADDIAFAHRSAYALTREGATAVDDLLAELGRSTGRRVVGVCPSSVVAVRSRAQGGSYETVLTRLVTDLTAAGHQVVLFPNATRAVDTDGERNNDLPLVRRVLAAAGTGTGPGGPVAVDADVDATQIKRVIAACDVVVASRFHAMVGALSSAVPVLVLGWSHKYAEVMARFGLDDMVSDHSRLSAAELRAAVEDALERRGELSATIRDRLPEVLAGARAPLAGLLEPSLGAGAATGRG